MLTFACCLPSTRAQLLAAASFPVGPTTPRPKPARNSLTAGVLERKICSKTNSPAFPDATKRVFELLFLVQIWLMNPHWLFAGLEKLISEADTSNPCMLPKATGTCRAFIPSFFFDTATGLCTSFTYTGCGGNANNFNSEDECDLKCNGLQGPVSPPPAVAADPGKEIAILHWKLVPSTDARLPLAAADEQLTKAERCSLPPVSTSNSCLAFIPSWTFNSTSGQCEDFVYGGCGKTANLFDSENACNTACGPDPSKSSPFHWSYYWLAFLHFGFPSVLRWACSPSALVFVLVLSRRSQDRNHWCLMMNSPCSIFFTWPVQWANRNWMKRYNSICSLYYGAAHHIIYSHNMLIIIDCFEYTII